MCKGDNTDGVRSFSTCRGHYQPVAVILNLSLPLLTCRRHSQTAAVNVSQSRSISIFRGHSQPVAVIVNLSRHHHPVAVIISLSRSFSTCRGHSQPVAVILKLSGSLQSDRSPSLSIRRLISKVCSKRWASLSAPQAANNRYNRPKQLRS